jgi:mono/diheme cytochrome c family protein
MLTRGWWIGIAMSCAACAAVTPGSVSPTTGHTNDVARGERVYARFCATCHGDKGDGHGPTAAAYGAPPPLDFTRGMYKYRTTETGQLPLRSDIVRVIERGVPGTTMPAWGRVLPPQDIDAAAAYIEGFSPRFAAEPESTRKVVKIPPEPASPLSASQIETGRLLFIAVQCWECHGVSGKGDGPAAGAQKDNWKRPVRPADLTRARSAADLYRTLATGLDGTPMSSCKRTIGLGRERLSNLGDHASQLDPTLVKQVRDLLAKLPSQDDLDNLSDAELQSVTETRLWLLVGYVRSIQHRPNPLDWLLLDDP